MSFLTMPAKDRITILFGLLLAFQAIILIVSLVLLPGLPLPDRRSSITPSAAADFPSTIETAQLLDVEPQADEVKASIAPLALEAQQLAATAETTTQVEHRVKARETLATIWAQNGAAHVGAINAALALQEAGIKSPALRIGEVLELSISSEGDIISLKKTLDDGSTLFLDGNSEEGYSHSIIRPEYVETDRAVSGTIVSSLSASASDLNVPYQIVDEFVDLFSSRVEFSKHLHPGDTFTVTYSEKRIQGQDKPVAISSIKTASIMSGGKMLVAIQHIDRAGKAHYYDEHGQPLGNYFLRYPLNFSRISSAFTWARFHPVLQITRPHYGVDFAAPIGTPVRAVADGVVVEAGYNGDSGKMVKIQHGDRYSTVYLHLSRIAADLRKGVRVVRGQAIGAVGSTGVSTGPHLHFGLWDRGKYVDPLKANLPSMDYNVEKLPPPLLAEVLQSIKQQHATITVASADLAQRRG